MCSGDASMCYGIGFAERTRLRFEVMLSFYTLRNKQHRYAYSFHVGMRVVTHLSSRSASTVAPNVGLSRSPER